MWNTRNKNGAAETVKAPRRRGPFGMGRFLFTLILGAALALYAASYLDYLHFAPDDSPTITGTILKDELKYVKDLVTVEYHYTNADKQEYESKSNIPFTKKSFIFSYDGVIRYGVDLKETAVQVDEASRTVIVTIPPSKLVSHEIDESSFRILDETSSLFNPVHFDDMTEFRQVQKTEMEKKAEARGLPQQARQQAAATIEALFRSTPGMENYDLRIRDE